MNIEKDFANKTYKCVKIIHEFEEKLKNTKPGTSGFSVGFKCDYIRSVDGRFEVITGNKNAPAGISLSEADYVAIESHPNVYVVGKEDLKHFIKANHKDLDKSIDEEFQHMSVMILNTSIPTIDPDFLTVTIDL